VQGCPAQAIKQGAVIGPSYRVTISALNLTGGVRGVLADPIPLPVRLVSESHPDGGGVLGLASFGEYAF
jgi:hypothetical protein